MVLKKPRCFWGFLCATAATQTPTTAPVPHLRRHFKVHTKWMRAAPVGQQNTEQTFTSEEPLAQQFPFIETWNS